MAFYVGQKVVCVDASPCRNTGELHLKKNSVYVIEGFDNHQDRGIFPAGVPRTFKYPDGTDVGWSQWRFRPVVERKTDISIFTAMLNPERANENVLP